MSTCSIIISSYPESRYNISLSVYSPRSFKRETEGLLLSVLYAEFTEKFHKSSIDFFPPFWTASKETKRIFFVKWHTLQKMIIIIPKILFPFSIREFPKNMIGYIEWPLVQKVESYWSSLFCENFFLYSITTGKR